MNILKFKSFVYYIFGLLIIENVIPNFLAKAENTNSERYANVRENNYKKNQINSEINFNTQNVFGKFRNYLYEDLIKLEETLLTEIDQNEIGDPIDEEKITGLDIESDSQYFIGETFYAEGNAVLFFNGLEIRGDKIIYDRTQKDFTVQGNVIFEKGEQYIEAKKLVYNFESGNGVIDNAYGVLNIENFNEDLKMLDATLDSKDKDRTIRDIEYIDKTRIGLINNFESGGKLNITDVKFEIPTVTKWRFKTEKFFIEDQIVRSENIYFTNDVFNKPQFFIQSKKFSGEMIGKKLKLVSGNSWIILDDKIRAPIGTRTIFDDDPVTSWGIGIDYPEKDGFFIFRSSPKNEIGENYTLKVQPYLLIQRAIQGKTNAFRDPNGSILSNKIKTDAYALDFFAIDAELAGKINSWELDLKTNLSSFNFDRLSEAFRSKFTLSRSFDLNKENTLDNISEIEKGPIFKNYLDLQIYNVFREKVYKGYSGQEEIYFGNGLNISNNKSWSFNDVKRNLSLTYDFGKFKAKSSQNESFEDLFRNVFAISYDYIFPIWKKSNLDKEINKNYKFSPTVIKQGVDWNTTLKGGLFLYSNDSSQNAISLTTGPVITLGSFTNNFLDYTRIKMDMIYTQKSGLSPFAFDDIDERTRLKFGLKQQLIGPLLFSYESFLNLDYEDSNYGEFSKPKFGIDLKRRAYSIGAFYDSSAQALGIEFNISNFNYDGSSSKF